MVLSQTGIGENPEGYNALRKFLERRGFRVTVKHTSGHDGAKGISRMVEAADAPFGVVTHGSAEQRKPAEKIITDLGKKALNPSEQDVIEVSDVHGCRIIGQEPSTMIYYSVKIPEGQYWTRGVDVEYYANVSHPEIRTPLGVMIRDMAKILPDNAGINLRARQASQSQPQQDPVLNLDGADLRNGQKRVQTSLPDYLIRKRLPASCHL